MACLVPLPELGGRSCASRATGQPFSALARTVQNQSRGWRLMTRSNRPRSSSAASMPSIVVEEHQDVVVLEEDRSHEFKSSSAGHFPGSPAPPGESVSRSPSAARLGEVDDEVQRQFFARARRAPLTPELSGRNPFGDDLKQPTRSIEPLTVRERTGDGRQSASTSSSGLSSNRAMCRQSRSPWFQSQ